MVAFPVVFPFDILFFRIAKLLEKDRYDIESFLVGIQKPAAIEQQYAVDNGLHRDSEKRELRKINLLLHALGRTTKGIPDEKPVGTATLLRLRQNLNPIIAT
eukprot:COSAG02_NODE_4986_length_4749_cov_4.965806_5_plen_102_part_00